MNKFFLFISFLLLSFFSGAQKIVPFNGPFPEPAPGKHMTFYLQRTVDRNTVIYELNYDPDGQLNLKNPIKIYWIDFEDGAKISQLTFVQSKFAYGLESKIIDETRKIFEINLVSYRKVKFYLEPSGEKNHYQTHATINGKSALLTKIFVKIIGGTYLNPKVSYVELVGKEIATGHQVSEQINPG